MLNKKTNRLKAILNQNKEKFIRLVALNKHNKHQIAIYYDYEIFIYDLQSDSYINKIRINNLKSIEFNAGAKLLLNSNKNEMFYSDLTSPQDTYVPAIQIKTCNAVRIAKWYPFNTSDFAYSTMKNEICYQSVFSSRAIKLPLEYSEKDVYVTSMEWYDIDENYKYILIGMSDGKIFLCDLSENNMCIVNSFDKVNGEILKLIWLSYEPGSFISIHKGSGRYLKWNVSKSVYNTIGMLSSFPIVDVSKFNATSIIFTNAIGDVVIYDIKLTKVIHSISSSHCQSIFDLKFNKVNSEIFATASYDGTIRLWNINSEKNTDVFYLSTSSNQIEINSDDDRKAHVLCIKWHPRYGNILASGDTWRMLRIWDTNKRKQVALMKLERKSKEQNEINGIEWIKSDMNNSDESDIMCGCLCNIYIMRFNYKTSQFSLVNTILVNHPVYNLIQYGDNVIAPCGDGDIRIFSIFSNNGSAPIRELKGHKYLVYALAVNSENILASSSDDFRIGVWNLNLIFKENAAIVENKNKFLLGHTDNVRQLVWFDKTKNKILVSGSWDSTIRFWDCTKMICISVISEHKSDVYGIDICPSHPFLLVSSSRDNTIRFWNYIKAMPISAITQFDKEKSDDMIQKAIQTASFYLYENDMISLFNSLKTKNALMITDREYKEKIKKDDAAYFSNIDYTKRKEEVLTDLIKRCAICGEWEKYCEYCMKLNRWEDAICASPHVSKEYWKYVSEKYAQWCDKENKDEKVLASLISDDKDIAIKAMMNREEYESAKLIYVSRINKKPIVDKPNKKEENEDNIVVPYDKEEIKILTRKSADYYLLTGYPLSAAKSYMDIEEYEKGMKCLIQSNEFEIAYYVMMIKKIFTYKDDIIEGLYKIKKLNMTQAEKSLLLEKASENQKARLMTIITKEENIDTLISLRNSLIEETMQYNIKESSVTSLSHEIDKVKRIKISNTSSTYLDVITSSLILEIINNNYKSIVILLKMIIHFIRATNTKLNDYQSKSISLSISYIKHLQSLSKSNELFNEYNIIEMDISVINPISLKIDCVKLSKLLSSIETKYKCTNGCFYYLKEEVFPYNIVDNYALSSFSSKKRRNNDIAYKCNLYFTYSEYLEIKKYINI